jgi:hypothetical protein
MAVGITTEWQSRSHLEHTCLIGLFSIYFFFVCCCCCCVPVELVTTGTIPQTFEHSINIWMDDVNRWNLTNNKVDDKQRGNVTKYLALFNL